MKKHSLLIIAGAAFWGVMGIFSRSVEKMGFTTLETASMRIIWGALLLCAIMLIKDKSAFKVRLRDLPLLAVTGGVSIFAMSFFYLSAISAASMSAAAILLYTAPFFVTAASALIYKERITLRTAAALFLAFLGSVLYGIFRRIGFGNFSSQFSEIFYGLLAQLILLNVCFGIFNLVPFPPLDGAKIVGAFLPYKTYFKIMQYERYAFPILIVLMYLGIFDKILGVLITPIVSSLNALIALIAGL